MRIARQAGEGDENGFTLVELMVVVGIIGILVAIAIPVLSGARARASDRAAQSDLRNATTSELLVFTNSQRFTDDLVVLNDIEPALRWTGTLATMTGGGNSLYVDLLPDTLTPGDTVLVGARSSSGKCFWVRTTAGAGSRYTANDCGAVPAVGAFAAAW